MELLSYLNFNGNCREAMLFYQACLGGELEFQTLSDSSGSAKMDHKMKNAVVQAKLQNKDLVLLATDLLPEGPLVNGNSVSLFLKLNNPERLKKLFNKLSSGGRKHSRPSQNQIGAWFGELSDKFGHRWLLYSR